MKTYQKIYPVTFSWKTKNGYGTMCYGEQILFLCKFCKKILGKKDTNFYISEKIVNLTQKFQQVWQFKSMDTYERPLLAYQEVNVMNMKKKILWIKYI